MTSARRIGARPVRDALSAGEDVLLVCAYDDDQKCRDAGIEPSIPLSELHRRRDAMSPEQRLVFF